MICEWRGFLRLLIAAKKETHTLSLSESFPARGRKKRARHENNVVIDQTNKKSWDARR